MSKTVEITSPEQFSDILSKSRIVVADFYANWCGPCKQIAPVFEQLSKSLSKPNIATFVKVNTEGDKAKDVAQAYAVTHLPTFILFRDGKIVEKLKSLIEKLSSDIETAGEGSSSGSGGMTWLGADLPRGYSDISDVIDVKGLELLNADDTEFSVRTLFNRPKPSGLDKSDSEQKDWVESDTDEQLLLFMPFNSSVKLHTIQITSLPPKAGEDDDEDEIPMRPKTIKLFTNRPHNLGFDEAEDIQPTQEIEIGEDEWNANGTANVGLRSETVRVDRIRLIGESGEKRDLGKLEKIGDGE
ncbi:thioredoxin [Apiospora kogelbergensis]|uniref:thioredoxin n=1 Tax=Apiospora kogelbergensis TaxID=1337665 RepID=UPI0031318900